MKKPLTTRIAEKSAGNGRTDLVVHHTHVVDNGNAMRVLATYTPMLGSPNLAEIENWFATRMGPLSGKVQANLRTLAVYPDRSFLTFLVEARRERQGIEASASMIKAGPDTFLDQSSNTLWETQTKQDGSKFLLRKESASVEELVSARKNQLRGGWAGSGVGGGGPRKSILLADVQTLPFLPGGNAAVQVSDVVDFLSNNEQVRGTVKSFNADGVKIALLNGGEVRTCDPHAIITIVEKGAQSVKANDERTRSYFRLQYPGNPEMTKIISPNASGPLTDPRALEVQPISASTTKTQTALRVGSRVSKSVKTK